MPCKSVCIRDVKLGIDPIHVWLGREQKMLGISQVLKPIKNGRICQKKEKMATTGVEYLGLGAL